MKNYEPKNIEKKWQDIWDEKKPFKCEINDKEKLEQYRKMASLRKSFFEVEKNIKEWETVLDR